MEEITKTDGIIDDGYFGCENPNSTVSQQKEIDSKCNAVIGVIGVIATIGIISAVVLNKMKQKKAKEEVIVVEPTEEIPEDSKEK